MTIAYLRSPSFSGSPMLDNSPPIHSHALPITSSSGPSAQRRWSTHSIDPEDIIVPNDNMEAGLSLRRLPASPSTSGVVDDDGPAPSMSRSFSDNEAVGLGISRRSVVPSRSSAHAARRSQLIFEQKLQEKRGGSDAGHLGPAWNGAWSASLAGGLTPRTRRKRPGTAPVASDQSPSPKTPESAPAFFDLGARKDGVSPGGLRELTIGAAAAPASKRASWIRRTGGEALSDSSHANLTSLSRSFTEQGGSISSRRHSSFLGEYRNGQTLPVFANTSFEVPSSTIKQAKRMSDGDIFAELRMDSRAQDSLPSPDEELEEELLSTVETDASMKAGKVPGPPRTIPGDDHAASNGEISTVSAAADSDAAVSQRKSSSSFEPVQEGVHEALAAPALLEASSIPQTSAAGAEGFTSQPERKSIEDMPARPATVAGGSLRPPVSTSELLAVPPRRSFDRRKSSPSERLSSHTQGSGSLDSALRRGSAGSAASAETISTYRIRRKPVPKGPDDDDDASVLSFVSASASATSPMSTHFDTSTSQWPTAASSQPVSPRSPSSTLEPMGRQEVARTSSEDNDLTPTIPQVQRIAHNRTPSGSDFMRKAQEAAQARMDQMKAEKIWEAARAKQLASASSAKQLRPKRQMRPSTAQAAPQSELKAMSLASFRSNSGLAKSKEAEAGNTNPSTGTSTPIGDKSAAIAAPDATPAKRARSRANLKRPVTAPSGAAGQFRIGLHSDEIPAFVEIEGQQFVLDDPSSSKAKEAEPVERQTPTVPNMVVLNRKPTQQPVAPNTRPRTRQGAKKTSADTEARKDAVGVDNSAGNAKAQQTGWGLEEEVQVSERALGSTTKAKMSTDSAFSARPVSNQAFRAAEARQAGPGGAARAKDVSARASIADAPPPGSYSIHPPSMLQLFEASQCTLYDEEGGQVVFGDLFKARRTLVCFLRHWWCGFCQQFAMSLKKVDPAPLTAANMELVVVGQGDWHIIKAYKQVMEVPFKMYADPKRNVYRALGMTMRTNEANPVCARPDYAQLGMTKGILVAIKKGLFDMPICSPGDMKLLGGDFILGPGLQCSFTHRMTTADGHMDVPRILAQAGCDLSLKTPKPPPSAAEAAARLATLAGGNRNGTGRSFGRSKQNKEAKKEAQALASKGAGPFSTLSSFGTSSSGAGSLNPLQAGNKPSRPSLWGRFPGSRLKSSRSQASLPSSGSMADLSHTFNSVREHGGRSLSIMRKISYESRHHDSYSSMRPPSTESSARSFYSGIDRSQTSTPQPPNTTAAVAQAAERDFLSPSRNGDILDSSRAGNSSLRIESQASEGRPERTVFKSTPASSMASADRSYMVAPPALKPLSDRALSTSALSRGPSRSATPLSNFQTQIMLRQRQSGGNLASRFTAQTPQAAADAAPQPHAIVSAGAPHQMQQDAGSHGSTLDHREFLPNGRGMPEAPESVQSHQSGSDLDSAEPFVDLDRRSAEVKSRASDRPEAAYADARESFSSRFSRNYSADGERTADSAGAGSFLMELDVYDSLSRQPSGRFYNDRFNGSDNEIAFDAGPASTAQPEAADSDSDTEPAYGSSDQSTTPTMVWTPRLRSPGGGAAAAAPKSSSMLVRSLSGGTLSDSTSSPASSRGSSFASPSMGSLYGFGGYRGTYGLSAHLEEEEEEE